MTKNISKITVLGLFAAALVALPVLSHAANPIAPASPDQTAPAKPNKHGIPFHGKLAAVDTKAMTLTVGKLTLQVASDTKITKDGQPATLTDGAVGEPVSGAYTKTEDGKLNAVSIHFGAKTGPKHNSEAGNK